jgi:predicted Rossmann fold flavoprotein
MENNTDFDVIVIGAGPAGMMAAGQAALRGMRVLLLEKTNAVGKKLSITGQKRCNLTNTAELPAFIDHFGREGRFLRQAFHQFFRQELLDFFAQLSIETESERGGRIFPSNGNASDVTHKLWEWASDAGVTLRTGTRVERVLVQAGAVNGVGLSGGAEIACKSVIMASGGATYTGTGSSGDGYRMAEVAGHTIVPLRPALVPMKTSGDLAQRMQGLPLRNARMQVFINEKRAIDAFGELLFTHFGISGPIVLTHSGEMVDALRDEKAVRVVIDTKPALDRGQLNLRMVRELDAGGKQFVRTMLKQLLPHKMIEVCLQECQLTIDQPCHQVTAEQRKRLVEWMKGIELIVTGPLSMESGMVTMGGVALDEVDARTMMSKKVKGLYFAGEVLDLAADTGGFNLQAAFSTGWVAGRNVSQSL